MQQAGTKDDVVALGFASAFAAAIECASASARTLLSLRTGVRTSGTLAGRENMELVGRKPGRG